MSGFTVKVRGGGLTLREYRCPEHGVFESLVPRDAGDQWCCPALRSDSPPVGLRCRACWRFYEKPTPPACDCGEPLVDDLCGLSSERCFTSAPAMHTKYVVSVSRGRDDPKPHPHAMDLRPLAEGQDYHSWKADRAKVWEAERQRRVMEFAKS
jgi:hypothetical protein